MGLEYFIHVQFTNNGNIHYRQSFAQAITYIYPNATSEFCIELVFYRMASGKSISTIFEAYVYIPYII